MTATHKADLFKTSQDALQFATDYDLDIARAMLLLKERKPAEAAEIHLAEGRIGECIDILLENFRDSVCANRAAHLMVKSMWRYLSFGVTVAQEVKDPLFGRWMMLAEQLSNVKTITERHFDEVPKIIINLFS